MDRSTNQDKMTKGKNRKKSKHQSKSPRNNDLVRDDFDLVRDVFDLVRDVSFGV